MTKILRDDDGNTYEVQNDLVPLQGGTLIVKPLPHPPAKETYYLKLVGSDWNDPLYVTQLDLTPDAADKVAKAVEALLEYIQDDAVYKPYKDGIWGVEKLANAARQAYQDGSTA